MISEPPLLTATMSSAFLKVVGLLVSAVLMVFALILYSSGRNFWVAAIFSVFNLIGGIKIFRSSFRKS